MSRGESLSDLRAVVQQNPASDPSVAHARRGALPCLRPHRASHTDTNYHAVEMQVENEAAVGLSAMTAAVEVGGSSGRDSVPAELDADTVWTLVYPAWTPVCYSSQ